MTDELDYAALQVKTGKNRSVREISLLANPEHSSFWKEMDEGERFRIDHNRSMISEFKNISEYLKDIEYTGKISMVLSMRDLDLGIVEEFEKMHRADNDIFNNFSVDLEDSYEDSDLGKSSAREKFIDSINRFGEYGISVNLSKPKHVDDINEIISLDAVNSVKLDVFKILQDKDLSKDQIKELISPGIEEILANGYVDTITYVGVEDKGQEDRLREVLDAYAEPHHIQIQGNVDLEKTNDLNAMREVIQAGQPISKDNKSTKFHTM